MEKINAIFEAETHNADAEDEENHKLHCELALTQVDDKILMKYNLTSNELHAAVEHHNLDMDLDVMALRATLLAAAKDINEYKSKHLETLSKE